MEKEWKSGEAIWHMKQAERNALDVAAMNKLNEIVDVAALRQRVAELEKELNEVRKAEREKCAALCEKSDRYRGDYFAAKIRAMGDE